MVTSTVLAAEAVTKRFGGTTVVDGADLALAAGRVHALVGENGAGKSTIIKMLSGVEQPDAGRLTLDGHATTFRTPADAAKAQVSTVYQELDVIDDLTVAENVMLGREPRRGPFLRGRELKRRAVEALRRAGSQVDADASPRALSLAQQQRVVIARALLSDARVLILDEPTAALGPHEVENLFALVRSLIDGGVAVLFVSHRLEEVLALADDVTVMRDGHVVLRAPAAELDESAIVNAMTGREIDLSLVRTPRDAGSDGGADGTTGDGTGARGGLRLSGIPLAEGTLELAVAPGEIVGVAGLAGSGRSRLLRTIVGAPWVAGSVTVGERTHTHLDPSSALRAGIGYLPEDRKRDGLVLGSSSPFNVALSSLVKSGPVMVTERADTARLEAATADLSLRGSRLGPVGRLSGGNQQKVLLARILAASPSVLLLDEPTRGVDIGAKQEIWDLLERVAASGVAVLLVSSELPEILRLSDRILVLSDGCLTGDFPAGTPQHVLIEAALPRRARAGSASGPRAAGSSRSAGSSVAAAPERPAERIEPR